MSSTQSCATDKGENNETDLKATWTSTRRVRAGRQAQWQAKKKLTTYLGMLVHLLRRRFRCVCARQSRVGLLSQRRLLQGSRKRVVSTQFWQARRRQRTVVIVFERTFGVCSHARMLQGGAQIETLRRAVVPCHDKNILRGEQFAGCNRGRVLKPFELQLHQ